MAKGDVVQQGVSDLQSAVSQAESDFLGVFYDKVVADQPPASGGISPDQEAADIKAAVDPLNQQISDLQAKVVQDAVDLQAKSDADAQSLQSVQDQLSQVQSQLQDMTGKFTSDEVIVQGLKGSIDQLSAALSALQAIFPPLPPPPAAA